MRNSLAYTKLEFKAPKKWLMCLIFLCPSLFICMQPLRECVCKQRFKPTPQRYSSVSKKISWENFGQCGSRVLCAELCNKNQSLAWGLCGVSSFVFRCWVLLKILFGQLSSLPWAFCGTPEIILSIEWQRSSPVSVNPMCTGKIPWMIRVAIANWTSLSQTNI